MADISAEELIPLVEQRPVIWDKNLDVFKDKALKTAAWREICCVFNPNFDKLEEKEMKDFAKSVSTKWVYIRDAFLRSQKKKMQPGAVKRSKPYVYTNLLSFLSNVNESQTRHDSFNESQSSFSESSSDYNAVPEKQFEPPPAKKLKIENVRTVDEKMIPFLDTRLSDQDEHPHISFMKGVLPSLATFNEDENLEFQAGVVELIQKIRRKRQVREEYPYDIKIFET